MDSGDVQIRVAAGAAIQKLIQNNFTNVINWAEIEKGFEFRGRKIHFASRALGIFKPKELADGGALSIRQSQPSRQGRRSPYDDSDLIDGFVRYKLQRGGIASHSNGQLAKALEQKVPLIYFRGVADAAYEIYYPVFVVNIDWDLEDAQISLGDPTDETEEAIDDLRIREPIKKGYSYGLRKTRTHQKAFRNHVLNAYGLRCALTGLPIPDLLEASHIIADSRDGEASVRNGIAMTKFHHAAYETNLMGIDADGKIHLSEEVRDTRDGPMFDYGLRQLEGAIIRLPKFERHRPSKDFLAERFEQFTKRHS